jgi:hypothetical protein
METLLCILWCVVQVLGLTNVSKWEQAPKLRKCIQQDAAIAGVYSSTACQDTVTCACCPCQLLPP